MERDMLLGSPPFFDWISIAEFSSALSCWAHLDWKGCMPFFPCDWHKPKLYRNRRVRYLVCSSPSLEASLSFIQKSMRIWVEHLLTTGGGGEACGSEQDCFFEKAVKSIYISFWILNYFNKEILYRIVSPLIQKNFRNIICKKWS